MVRRRPYVTSSPPLNSGVRHPYGNFSHNGCPYKHPLLALVPVMLFFFLFSISRKRFLLVTMILWLAYVPYEYGMKFRILCSGECNIRIDLLLLYPVLLVVSLVALVVFALAMWKRKPNPGVDRTA